MSNSNTHTSSNWMALTTTVAASFTVGWSLKAMWNARKQRTNNNKDTAQVVPLGVEGSRVRLGYGFDPALLTSSRFAPPVHPSLSPTSTPPPTLPPSICPLSSLPSVYTVLVPEEEEKQAVRDNMERLSKELKPFAEKDGIRIRKGTKDDKQAVWELMKEAGKCRGGLGRESDEMTEGYIDGILEAADGGVLLVAEAPPSSPSSSSSSSPLVGMFKCVRMGPHRCFRHMLTDSTLAIHPQYQNRKLGQRMLLEMMRRISELGGEYEHILRIELIARETNIHALRMYEKMGFRVQGKLFARILSGMPLELVPREKEETLKLKYESDIMMVWFNPNFNEKVLREQFLTE